MRITIVLAVLVFSTGIFLGSCGAVYAKDNDIGYSQIHPAHPLYFLKTIKESWEIRLAKTTNLKFLKHLEFATRRLREVKSLISKGRSDFIPSTLQRYISEVNSIPDKDISDASYTVRIRDTLALHLQVLTNLYQQFDQRGKMSARSAIYKIVQRADVTTEAKSAVCDLLQQEASSSALNATERIVLAERARSCFD